MPHERLFALGGSRPLDGSGASEAYALHPSDLSTHGAVVGMTGSGKTGLVMVIVEEALRSGVPVVMIDVKGDLPNLLLSFPEMSAACFAPWVDARAAARARSTTEELAEGLAHKWRAWLADWQLGPEHVAELRERMSVRLLTPGTEAGEPLHVLSALEHASPLWATDREAAREALSAAISLLLRLIGRDPDPTKSRDHVVLSVFAEARLSRGEGAGVEALLGDVRDPPLETIGAMPMSEFLPKRERTALATALNTLLASPTFEAWRRGAPLDVDAWLAPRADGRTQATIVSVAHLDDDERRLVLGVVLEQFLAWVRTQAGTHHPARAARLRRGLRLRAAAPREPADQEAAALAHEAGARLWSRCARRHAEPDGPRLPRAVQRRRVVRRPPADRRRPRACRRGHVECARRRRLRARRGRRRDQAPRAEVVRRAQRASGAGRGAAPVEDNAVVAARADDARGSAARAGAGVGGLR